MSKLAKAMEKARQVRSQRQDNIRQPEPIDVETPEYIQQPSHAESSSHLYPSPKMEDTIAETPYPSSTDALDTTFGSTKVLSTDDRHLENNRIITHRSSPAVLDSYYVLRTQILQRTKHKRWNTLMVTSPRPREGKSVTSVNLAMTIACQPGYTSLLVDANFRTPMVRSLLGLTGSDAGLTDYLVDDTVEIPNLLVNPGIEKMVVLPSGKPLLGSTDLLATPRMEHLVHEIKNRYPDRYVIYDCPHLLEMPDALVFANYVDAILLVVEANRTRKEDLEEACRLLEGKNVLGSFLTKLG